MLWLSPCHTILVFFCPSFCLLFLILSSSSFSVSYTSSLSQFCPHFLYLLLSFLSSSVFLCVFAKLYLGSPPRTISRTSTSHVHLIFVRWSHSHNVHHIPGPNTCHKEAKSNKECNSDRSGRQGNENVRRQRVSLRLLNLLRLGEMSGYLVV